MYWLVYCSAKTSANNYNNAAIVAKSINILHTSTEISIFFPIPIKTVSGSICILYTNIFEFTFIVSYFILFFFLSRPYDVELKQIIINYNNVRLAKPYYRNRIISPSALGIAWFFSFLLQLDYLSANIR